MSPKYVTMLRFTIAPQRLSLGLLNDYAKSSKRNFKNSSAVEMLQRTMRVCRIWESCLLSNHHHRWSLRLRTKETDGQTELRDASAIKMTTTTRRRRMRKRIPTKTPTMKTTGEDAEDDPVEATVALIKIRVSSQKAAGHRWF
jgi:hypothetical protein